MAKRKTVWSMAFAAVATLALGVFSIFPATVDKASAETQINVVSVTEDGSASTYAGATYNRLYINFDTEGANASSLYSNTFNYLHSITLNGEKIYELSYSEANATGNSLYYSSSYYDTNNMKVLKAFYPDALYQDGAVNVLTLPAGTPMASGYTVAEKSFYGACGAWFDTRTAAEEALAESIAKPEKVEVIMPYELNRNDSDGNGVSDNIQSEEAFQVVYVTFPEEGVNDVRTETTGLSILRNGVKVNGTPIKDVIGSVINSCYFEGSNLKLLKLWLPYSLFNWDTYDTLEIPGGFSYNGKTFETTTFYGKGGVWQATNENLPDWELAEIDKLYETYAAQSGNNQVFHDINVLFKTDGTNSGHEATLTLWYLQHFTKLNGVKAYESNGFYFDTGNLKNFFARVKASNRNTDGTPDELYIPKFFRVGNKIYRGGETWYGRYGVWSKNVNDLPAVDDPNYVGSVESIYEPYGVVTAEMGGIYYRQIQIKFTLPAAIWGDGDKYQQEANLDRIGYALQTLRDGILINGKKAISESRRGNCYWQTGKAQNWQVLQCYINSSGDYRDPHGNDTITIPAIRLADGKVTKEQNLYYYDDVWHLQPKDLQPFFSAVTENTDEYTGKLVFERACANVEDAVTSLDKIQINGKTVAEINASETLVSLAWASETELTYTIKKSVVGDNTLNIKLLAGFTFPTGETLREDCNRFYVETEGFWVSSLEQIEKAAGTVYVTSVDAPVKQAGNTYMITVRFNTSLIWDYTYIRMADVTKDMNTLYAKSVAQEAGYYYDQSWLRNPNNSYERMYAPNGMTIAERAIRLGVRESVLNGIRLNNKLVKNMDGVQIDFYGDQMLIFVNEEVNAIQIEAGVTFHSGKATTATQAYALESGVWRETDNGSGVTLVEALIDEIPDVITVEAKTAIETAKAEYDSLSDEDKANVSAQRVEKLNKAMEKLIELTTSNIISVTMGSAETTWNGEQYRLIYVDFDRGNAENGAMLWDNLFPWLNTITLNGEPINPTPYVFGADNNPSYYSWSFYDAFDPARADESKIQCYIPLSKWNADGVNVLRFPAGTIFKNGVTTVEKTYYGGADGVWYEDRSDAESAVAASVESVELLPNFGTFDGVSYMGLTVTFNKSGSNDLAYIIHTLFPWAHGITFNGEKVYPKTYAEADAAGDMLYYPHTYFTNSECTKLRIFIPVDNYDIDGVNVIVFPAGLTFSTGEAIAMSKTFYGRYGKFVTSEADLPAENDPAYVGSVEYVEEPYGNVDVEMGGTYHRLLRIRFTIPVAIWGDGASYQQEANQDVYGSALYALRRGLLINGKPAVAESKMGNCWFYPDKGNNWTLLNVWVTNEYRDSHGRDTITIPMLMTADGKIIPEQNLYYYNDIWHFENKDLQPFFSSVTESADEYTGKLVFERACANAEATVTSLDKIQINGKTVAEINASETLVSLAWASETELTYTIKKSVVGDNTLNIKLLAGFAFPTGETLREDCNRFYVAEENFFVSSLEKIEADEYSGAKVKTVDKPVKQAGGTYMITVTFNTKLVWDYTYIRMADVTKDMYTLYTKSVAQEPGYYYDQSWLRNPNNQYEMMYAPDGMTIAERTIRLGVRASVLDLIKLNGKTIRETTGVQIDFYDDQMLIFVTGDVADLTELEIGVGVVFHSGKQTDVAKKYAYANEAWKEVKDSTDDGKDPVLPETSENAQAVIDLIDAIPVNVTAAEKEQVLAAKAAYDALTETEKAEVPKAKLNKLTAALEKVNAGEETPDDPTDSSSGTASTLPVSCGSCTGTADVLGIGAALAVVGLTIATIRKKDEE